MTEDYIIKALVEHFTFTPVLKNYPLERMRASQWFEQNYSPIYVQQGRKSHGAIDFFAATGTKAYAPVDGTITEVVHDPEKNTHEGEHIKMRSEEVVIDGTRYCLEFWFLHIDKSLVSLGQKVVAGQEVVLTDNTGFSSGPHLHFEVRLFKKIGWRDTDWVVAFPDNGWFGSINPLPFFYLHYFTTLNPEIVSYPGQPYKNPVFPGNLIKPIWQPHIYFVDEKSNIIWIEDMHTLEQGEKTSVNKWNRNNIISIPTKIKHDFSIRVRDVV